MTDDTHANGLALVRDLDHLDAAGNPGQDGVDDTLRYAYAVACELGSAECIPFGPFASIRFDCPDGTLVRPGEFMCTIVDASDEVPNTLTPAQHPTCTVSVFGAPPTTSTTTTVPPTSTTLASLPATTSTSTTTSTTSTSTASTTTTSTTTAAMSSTTSTTGGGGSTSSTSTTSSSTTTTTLQICGDGVIEGSETCDDGNTKDGDGCPSSCRVETCTPILPAQTTTFSIDLIPPAGIDVYGATVLVDYPEGEIIVVGHGSDSSVKGSISNVPPGTLATPNDLDYALRKVLAGTSPLPAGRLFTMTLQKCAGAPAPTVARFNCTVEDTSDADGNFVAGVTCNVTAP